MRSLARCLALLSVTPVALALPVVSRPAARPHPVAPKVYEHAARGLDARALAALPLWTSPGPRAARPLVLTAATADKPFQALGVTWAPGTGSDADVMARVRQHGAWSDWHALDTDGDHGPDATGPDAGSAVRPGTTEWYTGPADGWQVRVATRSGTPPRDVRVALVDPGRSDADSAIGASPTLGSASAEASIGQPSIVSRAGWGADESLRSGTPDYSDTIRMGFVHHTDTTNSYSPPQAASLIRSVYAYHVRSRGWSDIGYNFLVDKYGRIFEGRAGGVDRPVIGAHTGGFNTDTFGVSLLGTYTSVAPSAAELGALEKVFAWKMGLHYVNPMGTSTLTSRGGTKYASGTQVTFANVSGHRDAGLTSCPGNLVYNKLSSIRSGIRYDMAASLFNPRVSTTLPVYKTTVNLTVKAGLPATQSWRLTIRNARSGATVRTLSGTAGVVDVAWDLRDSAGLPVVPDRYDLTLQSWTSKSVARPYVARIMVVSALPDGVAVSRTDHVPYGVVEGGRLLAATAAMAGAVRQAPVVAYYGSYALLASPATPPRDGLYVKSPAGTPYLVVDGALRPVTSSVVSSLGLTGTARLLPSAVLSLLTAGPAWTDAARHPDGTVVTSGTDAWRLEAGRRRAFTSPASRAAWSKSVAVAPASPVDLARPLGAPLAPPEGVVLRTATGAGVVSGGTFRPFGDTTGYGVTSAPLATTADLAALPTGDAVAAGRHPSGTLLRNGSGYAEVLGTTKRAVDPALVAADPRVPLAPYSGELPSLTGAKWVPPSGLAGVGADGLVRVMVSGRLATLDAALARTLGYTSAGLPHLEAADFGPVPVGTYTDSAAHPSGSLVTSGGTYWLLDAGTRRPLAASLRATWLGRPALPATQADLALPVGAAAPPADGAWVATPDGAQWLVYGGVRRSVSVTVARRLGLNAVPAIPVAAADLNAATKAGTALP